MNYCTSSFLDRQQSRGKNIYDAWKILQSYPALLSLAKSLLSGEIHVA